MSKVASLARKGATIFAAGFATGEAERMCRDTEDQRADRRDDKTMLGINHTPAENVTDVGCAALIRAARVARKISGRSDDSR